MQLTLEQACDYLQNATVERSVDTGHAITHFGLSAAGARFVMVNDCYGETALIESV